MEPAIPTPFRLMLLGLCAACAGAQHPADDPGTLPPAFVQALAEGRSEDARAALAALPRSGRSSVHALVRLAAQLHDPALLREAASESQRAPLAQAPQVRAELALVLGAVLGPAEALPLSEAACGDRGLGEGLRAQACSLAALGRLAGQAPRTVEGGPRASLDLLTQIPLPIVLASVNGLPPEPFIIDTGAAVTLLSQTYCDRTGISYLFEAGHPLADPSLPQGPRRSAPARVFPALVDRIDLGGISVRNWSAQVLALPPELKVAGILSPQDTLRGMLVELDGRALRLRLYRDLDTSGWRAGLGEPSWSAPLSWSEGQPFVRATVGPLPAGWFLLDLGAGGNQLTPEAAKRLGHGANEGRLAALLRETSRSADALASVVAVDGAPGRKEELILGEEPLGTLDAMGTLGFPWAIDRRVALSPDGTAVSFTAPR